MKMNAAALEFRVSLHVKYLAGEYGGKRLSLHGAYMPDSDLRGVDLRKVELIASDLSGANLSGANLTSANLTSSVLIGADLREANLSGANLRFAHLSEADLTGAKLDGFSIPVVPHIDAAILEEIENHHGHLNMDKWHTCETTHCRAGWAITLAGPAGKRLEWQLGPEVAGALIYAASRPGRPVPDFFATKADALADIRESAAAA